MQTYTLICDWQSLEGQLMDARFVIVTTGETYEEARSKAAQAALVQWPHLAETETPSTFWDNTAFEVAALYGDHISNLVDRPIYDILNADSLLSKNSA